MDAEQRPLLEPGHDTHGDESPHAKNSSNSDLQRDNDEHNITPLPMKQVSILLLMQLSEPFSYTVIRPFVARLINETGITGGDGSKIGYYAGMIGSIFFITESLFMLQYGRVSDRVGRRPVLMFGLFGQALSIFLIGLSKRFWQLVFSRALCGALNGNIGVTKSMLVELSDETNQAQELPAFALTAIVWSTGATLGPLLGGTLSHPAKIAPVIFDTPFWNTYPYFLPCLAAAIYAICLFVVAMLFLKETLVIHNKTIASTSVIAEYGTIPSRPPPPKRSPSLRSVLTKRARIAIANYAFLALADIAYINLVPVVFAISVDNGGLGFSPREIGVTLGLQGILIGIIQALFFPPLHRRFGSKRLYTVGYACYTALIISLPLMHILAKLEMRRILWVVLGFNIGPTCLAYMSFSCMSIFVNNSAPSRDSLGTLNGVSQTIISITRGIGPAATTSLLSLSSQKNLLGGNLVYVVLFGIGCLGIYASQWLKEEGRAYEQDEV